MGNCPGGELMSWWGAVLVGSLSWWGVVGELSWLGVVQMGSCPIVGNCLVGSCAGGELS